MRDDFEITVKGSRYASGYMVKEVISDQGGVRMSWPAVALVVVSWRWLPALVDEIETTVEQKYQATGLKNPFILCQANGAGLVEVVIYDGDKRKHQTKSSW